MASEARSRAAREASEQALVRVVHHYGGRPEFVVIGGLVPELLCSASDRRHAGTTDVDVQVDLEIVCGSVNMRRLETALRNAEFEPDDARSWRWLAVGSASPAVVRFELLADLDDQPAAQTIIFDGCERLGAANLRGSGFAARDAAPRSMTATVGGERLTVDVNVTGLAGYLMAKVMAAHGRNLPKDWYDISFVLIHNDRGGPRPATTAVRSAFGTELVGSVRTAHDELRANFDSPRAQGPVAYAEQYVIDHPDADPRLVAADAVVAVQQYCDALLAAAVAPDPR